MKLREFGILSPWPMWTVLALLFVFGVAAQAQGEDLNKALHKAMASKIGGDIPEVKRLLAMGADPNSTDFGVPALEDCVNLGRVEVARLLIEKGAKLEYRNQFDGRTNLHNAASRSHPKMVELLLEKGAKVNERVTNTLRTALMLASFAMTPLENVKVLLAGGAEVNLKDKYGLTALHFAAAKGYAEIIRILVAQGADPTVKDLKGLTPLDWAKKKGQKEAIAALEAARK